MAGVGRVDSTPSDFLAGVGRVFATFDAQSQDSGNVSYGVEIGGKRLFVKTAGSPRDRSSYLDHCGRVRLLRNAIRLARSRRHPAMPALRRVVESPQGPMLFYDWADGELVRHLLDRVRRLPPSEVADMLTVVYDLHEALAADGWVAVDFYDGSMIYDFERKRLSVVDLDSYSAGAFPNRMGRMFGSTRFMAPEEFRLGAVIDERTTVFTLGRTGAVLLSDGSLDRAAFRGTRPQLRALERACRPRPDNRFRTVAEMNEAWRRAS